MILGGRLLAVLCSYGLGIAILQILKVVSGEKLPELNCAAGFGGKLVRFASLKFKSRYTVRFVGSSVQGTISEFAFLKEGEAKRSSWGSHIGIEVKKGQRASSGIPFQPFIGLPITPKTVLPGRDLFPELDYHQGGQGS